jgi:hypothetical protein
MNNIILKIIDENQYKISSSHKNININSLISNSYKTLLINSRFNLFNSVDQIETSTNIEFENFYIFPIFYMHEESSAGDYTSWINFANKFLKENFKILNQKNVAICICDFFEASSRLLDQVEALQKMFDLNFWIITADKKIKSNKIKIIYNNIWIDKFEPLHNPVNFKPKKLYINLTRVARYHRCLLAEQLIDNNLLKIGFNSWSNTYGAFDQYKISNPNTKIDIDFFNKLDIEDLSSINPNFSVPIEHCSKSFLFLNTETNVNSDTMFFSEKVYKPIGIGMPFITLGNPGTLSELRNQGFLTFDEWFDESYDLNFTLEKRIELIIKNLIKYSKYNKNDLIKIRTEMNEVTNYNLNLYKVIKTKNVLRENISLIVKGLV